MAPLISVALSTYNGAAHLPAQLDSVLAQRDVTVEVVAVDDGSSDACPEILATYAAYEPRVRWERNPHNLGPTASFERALSLCQGDYLAPCDQDDIWLPDKLSRLLSAIGGYDLAYCDSEYVDAEGRSQGERVSQGRTMLEGVAPLPFLFANSVSGHAALLTRALFEAVRPFPTGVYHDWWLALCAAGRNGVTYLPEPLVQFRRHEAAFSPVGRAIGRDDATAATAARKWLEHRQRLVRAYADLGLRDHARATELAEALRVALDTGRSASLLRWLWRERRELPRDTGVPALDAVRQQALWLKKLRRARDAA